MKSIGGESHLVYENSSLAMVEGRLNIPLNPSTLQTIEKLRSASSIFINNALQLNTIAVDESAA